MYQVIFIDIDGTLRNDKNEITDRTKTAIKKIVEKGIKVVICSGRYRQYTEEVSKQASASNYIISSNGGEVYDYLNKKSIYKNTMENKEIVKLMNIAKKGDVQFLLNCGDKRIIANIGTNERISKDNIILREPLEEFLENHLINQCVLSSFELNKLKKIKEEIENINTLEIVNLSRCMVNQKLDSKKPYFIDVACKGTSKGHGIKVLCEYLNIDLYDSVAIGDGYNDLPMFEVVGHTVAMENAPDEIKKITDEVTDNNNNDGVAKFLEKLEELQKQ